MNATIDIVRGELERLFSLEELQKVSGDLLGLAPEDVGGTGAKATFARALTERCVDGHRLEALVDVIRVQKREVDPRLFDLGSLLGKEELPGGHVIGEFTVQKKIGESELSIVYLAQAAGKAASLKVLRRDAARDVRAVHRFLTANRLVASLEHPGLPKGLRAGEIASGVFYVAYDHVEGVTLAARLARTGPAHVNELKALLKQILEPLAAMHRSHLAHGNLKLENVLIGKDGEGNRAVLIDFGADRLRQKAIAANGHSGVLAVLGSPKTIAPEVVRGKQADARSDVYAFGSMMYELVSGKPVFLGDTATDTVFQHIAREPEAPSAKAPRGWVGKEVDELVLSMLSKDPARRPKDAQAVLDALEGLGRVQAASKAQPIAPEKVDQLIELLGASPDDSESAMQLEKAVDQGADARKVAEAFASAATKVDASTDDGKETVKGLYYRAARIFDAAVKDKAQAEAMYIAILTLDPTDDIASIGLEEVRKALGKYEEIVEMLLERSQNAAPGEERARALAEIGRLYGAELDDADQAVVAYAQALCEAPGQDDYAQEIEQHCGSNQARWGEVLGTVTEAIKSPDLQPGDRNALLLRAGAWYEGKLGRADLALMAFQQVLAVEPSHDGASERLTAIYRKAQQWPELANVLKARADAAGSTPKGRDLKTEAAELLETKLNDTARARDLYLEVLGEDPGHTKASEAMARLAERTGDFQTLVKILEQRAESRMGQERADALCKVAEVYEDHLNDLAEATRRYEAALAIAPSSLTALKGLDRIFNRNGQYRELLEVLEKQIAVAATPRQKINLFERMAALYDEEFLDHGKAAEALEAVLEIDGSNDGALTGLVRHYRALDKWEPVTQLLERHANLTTDVTRRIELLLARARALAEQVGSPDRATRAYEEILKLQPGHAGALEALAHLREATGDAHAALSAIEALALKAPSAEAKAEQWMRAARLLESRGDKDGAIERYKLALDVSPKDVAAATALRKAYAHRGDWTNVIALVERDLGHAEGDLAKARLHGELARVYHPKLEEKDKAEAAARKALDLDATCIDALMVMGDVAYDAGRMLEAAKHFETLVGRSNLMAKEDAVRVLVRFLEAFGKANRPAPSGSLPPDAPRDSQGRISIAPTSQSRVQASAPPPPVTNPRMIAAVEALQTLAPKDVEALSRAANALFEFGDPKTAYKMHDDLFKSHGKELAGADRAEALYHLGESARRSGDLDAALAPLKEAADLDPSNPRPLRALARIHEERGEWEDAVKVRKRRLTVAVGAERFELLLEIGDIEFQKLSDRARAGKTYQSALEERPDDRKLLTKLMQLYSEEKDWAKLVDVVLRLADFVEDPKQRAKYMHTAATIASRQLTKVDQALGFYERAIEFDPSLTKAIDEALELYRQKADHASVKRLLNMQLEHAKTSGDRAKIVKVLDALGDLYRKFLNEPVLAIDAYEAAQAFEPDDKARQETLAELYASDPKQYLDKAVKSQTAMLRKNPYKVEAYKLMRRLFTESKRADPAWCLCQALSVLNLAEPDEERFYKKHRTDTAAPAQAAVDENDWGKLQHQDLDPLVTKLFAMIQPTIMRVRTQPLEQMGYDPRYAIDTSLHPYPVSQTLYYALGVLGMQAPLVFQNNNDPASLGFLHARTPGIVLGRAAFDTSVPTQSLAFVAGRHLTYFRPGYYVRHLVPTGTGLKAWLFAAIKMSVPSFPVAPDMMGQVNEAMGAMAQDFQGAQKELLASHVSKLIQAGGSLDLKKWVASIDLTADRAGFLLAHDLGLTAEVIRATEEGSSVPIKERLKEIVLFSISEEYFGLRDKLGISIDS
jgi:tetratricopeptide (TPR) repeat protein/predicted Ser/Thr protein kinase